MVNLSCSLYKHYLPISLRRNFDTANLHITSTEVAYARKVCGVITQNVVSILENDVILFLFADWVFPIAGKAWIFIPQEIIFILFFNIDMFDDKRTWYNG